MYVKIMLINEVVEKLDLYQRTCIDDFWGKKLSKILLLSDLYYIYI